MGRNLDHRVEILFPVENRRLLARLREEVLGRYVADNRNARHLRTDGVFV